jgi:hypothetical protein
VLLFHAQSIREPTEVHEFLDDAVEFWQLGLLDGVSDVGDSFIACWYSRGTTRPKASPSNPVGYAKLRHHPKRADIEKS